MPRTRDKTQIKETIIACYCHFTGFAAVQVERITADYTQENWEKRWTVSKLVNGVPSFEQIEKQLLELQSDSNHVGVILINKDFKFLDKILNYKLKFREIEIGNLSEDFSSFNANIFTLISVVNDKKLLFRKECSELVEQIKFFNVANCSNDLSSLLVAVKSIPSNSFNYLLTS